MTSKSQDFKYFLILNGRISDPHCITTQQPDFKWLGFRISDPFLNLDHLHTNLFLTIQNRASSDFKSVWLSIEFSLLEQPKAPSSIIKLVLTSLVTKYYKTTPQQELAQPVLYHSKTTLPICRDPTVDFRVVNTLFTYIG